MSAVTIPVMAKARIGHFAEAQILEAIGVDMIDESEGQCFNLNSPVHNRPMLVVLFLNFIQISWIFTHALYSLLPVSASILINDTCWNSVFFPVTSYVSYMAKVPLLRKTEFTWQNKIRDNVFLLSQRPRAKTNN